MRLSIEELFSLLILRSLLVACFVPSKLEGKKAVRATTTQPQMAAWLSDGVPEVRRKGQTREMQVL
jgi:uncharacterized membrane protein